MFNNKFIIAFEGNHGSGKTTQCNKLCDSLVKEGLCCRYIKLLSKANPSEQMLTEIKKNCNDELFTKFKKLIRIYETSKTFYDEFTANSKHEIIVLDRYKYTGKAVLNINNTEKYFHGLLLDWLPIPDILFYLEIDSKTAMSQVISRGDRLRKYDTAESFRELSDGFINVFKNIDCNFYRIDATRTIESIHDLVVTNVMNAIKNMDSISLYITRRTGQ